MALVIESAKEAVNVRFILSPLLLLVAEFICQYFNEYHMPLLAQPEIKFRFNVKSIDINHYMESNVVHLEYLNVFT